MQLFPPHQFWLGCRTPSDGLQFTHGTRALSSLCCGPLPRVCVANLPRALQTLLCLRVLMAIDDLTIQNSWALQPKFGTCNTGRPAPAMRRLGFTDHSGKTGLEGTRSDFGRLLGAHHKLYLPPTENWLGCIPLDHCRHLQSKSTTSWTHSY